MLIEHQHLGIGNRTTDRDFRSQFLVWAGFIERGGNRGLGWTIGVDEPYPVANQSKPEVEDFVGRLLATQNHQPERWWHWKLAFDHFPNQQMPVSGWQIKHRNARCGNCFKEFHGRRHPHVFDTDQRGASLERWENFFDSRVKAERGKLQHPVSGCQAKFRCQRTGQIDHGLVFNGHAFGHSSRTRGVNDIHRTGRRLLDLFDWRGVGR